MGLDVNAWSGFDHDPRDLSSARLRAADADRLLATQFLTEAYVEGRIDLVEHDERAERARSARLLGELVPLLEDVVPLAPPSPPAAAGLVVAGRADLERRAAEKWAEQRRAALMGFVAPTLITWAVFAAIVLSSPDGWHFPWPLIVMAVAGVNLVRVQVQRSDIVASNLQDLERKRAKALAKQAKARRAISAGTGERERLDPEAVRAASELARRKARETARVVEQDVVRRFNERFKPPEPS